jgi:hypothetical protein
MLEESGKNRRKTEGKREKEAVYLQLIKSDWHCITALLFRM